MRRLFAAAGVDFEQWKALTIAALKLDFRTSLVGAPRIGRASRGVAAALLPQAIFYTTFGVFMAFLVWFSRDLFLTGTVAMSYTIFMVGIVVLLDHNSALISPADYAILGFRPITSRTYFAVRLTNVLVFTTALTTMAAWLPAVSLFIRHGFAVGAAGVVAFYACSISTALVILLGYSWMMRFVGPAAVKRALSYVQLVMSFAVYGGYFLISGVISKAAFASFTLPKTPWLLLYPGTWFATYLELAAGRTGWTETVPAAASIVAVVAMVSALGGRLSLDYSERLGALMSATASSKVPTAARARGGLWFRTGEARAVALLVRSQFRNDQRFKMGVLSILPMTLMYIVMGVQSGAVTDPFVPGSGRQGFSLVSMAILIFPSMLKLHVTHSEAYRASWIFFACPSDRMRIVRSSKNVLVAFFLVPYLTFVAAIFMYLTGSVLHVAVHIALMGLLSHLVLQFAVLVDPELPFSRPAQKGRNSAALFAFMILMAIVSGFLQVFSPWIYASLIATAAVFGTIALASAGVDRLTRARVERQTASLEFEG